MPTDPAVEPDGDPVAEYGPGGYLPPRAAKRARKIVLREQMGIHWPIAAVVAGVLIVLVTLPVVLSSQGPPDAPFVNIGPLSAIPANGAGHLTAGGRDLLVVRGTGTLLAFIDPPTGADFCPQSRRIESGDGTVWSIQGRLIAGDIAADTASLRQVQISAYEESLFVDPTTVADPLEPRISNESPGCP